MKNVEKERERLITLDSVNNARNKISCLGNEVLYDLCKKYPNTNNLQQVYAKIWLIGKSYSVPLERAKNNATDNEKFVNDFIAWNKSERFDEKLYSANDEESAFKVYTLLLKFVLKETGQYKRSFVSKYLHFHKPDYFKIYDSYTRKAGRVLSNAKYVRETDGIDPDYADFCAKENDIRKYVKERFDIELNNRDLDTLLVRIGKKLSKKQ